MKKPGMPETSDDDTEESTSEPVIEMAEADADIPMIGDARPEPEEPKGPAKRGWWQRR